MPFFCELSLAKMAFFQPLSLLDASTDAPKQAHALPRFVALASGRKKPCRSYALAIGDMHWVA